MLASGLIFAGEVMRYMKSELYQRFPVISPEKDEDDEDLYRMQHAVKISFAARPPLNGAESKEWLEKYAKWLRYSIKQMTFGPENPKSSAEFRGIGDSAMDDGILLMKTMDAISRVQD